MNPHFAQRASDITPFYVMELLKRAKQLEQSGRDIIHLEIGEPDFNTPKPILEAAENFIRKGEVKYTEALGLLELRKAISEFYEQRYRVKIPSARIVITPGASGALLLAMSATVNAGSKVLVTDPCYPCNRNFLQFLGAEAKAVPVNSTSNFQLTAELISDYWEPLVSGVLLASPSNPTGTLVTPNELKAICDVVDSHSGWLFSDEIYHGLEYGIRSETALKVTERTFVINSFSKYFGMTGWRIGWLVVPEDFIGLTERLAQNLFISTSTVAQFAALAAFTEETMAECESRRLEFEKRRDYLHGELVKLGFEIPCKPEGAFYIYANCEKFSRNSYEFAYDLLEEQGVAITPGRDFGQNDAEFYVRFAYTTSLDRIAEAMIRLENFIKNRG